jgi:hypothetical protein
MPVNPHNCTGQSTEYKVDFCDNLGWKIRLYLYEAYSAAVQHFDEDHKQTKNDPLANNTWPVFDCVVKRTIKLVFCLRLFM